MSSIQYSPQFLSRPSSITRIALLVACTATFNCRPETLLVYEIKPPEKVEGWHLYRYDRGTSLRAEAEFDTIKLSVVVPGPRALADLAQRISEKRDRGRLDVQAIRIVSSKAAEPDVALNFSEFVIVHNGNLISQI
ncbi:MAG: hypothetical protein JNM27_12030, partial [Leptospirales bacterium]|nr:hypothetical protein [Leptospirales bacterium]